MATYSYSIETKIPLTTQQQANFRRDGSVPDSVRQAADKAAIALANSTFGSSYTEGSISVAFVANGNYIKSTQINSPAEVPASSLPPGIAPVAGAVNRLVETRAPVTTEDTPLSPLTPTVVTSSPVVPGPVIETPPAAVQSIVVPPPVVETTPVPAAPLAFEPLTVGGRILAPAEFEGAADRLVVNPPPNTNPAPVATGEGNPGGSDPAAVPTITAPAAVSVLPDPTFVAEQPPTPPTTEPPPALDPNTDGVADLFTPPPTAAPAPVENGFIAEQPPTPAPNNNSVVPGLTNSAKDQSTLLTRENLPTAADWRVRLSLAPNADYLYNAANAGILAPLAATGGVIFPYTPTIDTSYQAKYDQYNLTHSNYRGYFYQNSSVENITVKGTFTAQDTKEAEYLLAVIHFFKSVTKMFYGQGSNVGAPPPLVYLSGFGQFQFNKHPCVVSTFSYTLPNDVDYIRATGFNNIGLNLQNRRDRSSGPGPGGSLGTVIAIIDRLKNAGLPKGGIGYVSDAEQTAQMNNAKAATNQNSTNSTYVPTMIEISITLLPMQTRNQVSKEFSLDGFANGTLLTKGFW